MPLEELLVRHALGMPGTGVERERDSVRRDDDSRASRREFSSGGRGGRRRARCRALTETEITARIQDRVTAWPEGSSYLGFIFARGSTPEDAEAALREAHGKLRFVIRPELPVEHPLSSAHSDDVTARMPR